MDITQDAPAAIGAVHPVAAKSPVVVNVTVFSGTVWLFFSVIVFATLVVPSIWLLNETELADNVAGSTPLPVADTVWGEVAASSLTVMFADSEVKEVGVKTTVAVQFAPAASVVVMPYECDSGSAAFCTT